MHLLRPCIFPFIHGFNGKTYETCAKSTDVNMKAWCPLEVDENGVFDKDVHPYVHCNVENCGLSEGVFIQNDRGIGSQHEQLENVYQTYVETRRTFETVRRNAGSQSNESRAPHIKHYLIYAPGAEFCLTKFGEKCELTWIMMATQKVYSGCKTSDYSDSSWCPTRLIEGSFDDTHGHYWDVCSEACPIHTEDRLEYLLQYEITSLPNRSGSLNKYVYIQLADMFGTQNRDLTAEADCNTLYSGNPCIFPFSLYWKPDILYYGCTDKLRDYDGLVCPIVTDHNHVFDHVGQVDHFVDYCTSSCPVHEDLVHDDRGGDRAVDETTQAPLFLGGFAREDGGLSFSLTCLLMKMKVPHLP